MYSFTPMVDDHDAIRATDPHRPTRVMAILNLTPDSFSDGGVHKSTDANALRDIIQSHIAAGATIIDIGGQSSRPGAPDVSADEEISRIVPAIEAVRSASTDSTISISIDTYRAKVAQAAIEAGAHIINDISAGLLDDDMLPTIAKLGCTYIMMHMRGTPATMQNAENCSYPKGVVETVAAELGSRVAAAEEAGIHRWRLVLDPGIGFAKTLDQNLELLRRTNDLRSDPRLRNLPWLVGTSRKGFIGQITGVKEARQRTWGTAATVAAAVAGGADIVRVHDVGEMAQVAKMADAIYRR